MLCAIRKLAEEIKMLPTLVREKNRFPWFGTRSDFDRLFDEFITGFNGGLGLIEPRTVGPMVFMPPIDMKESDTGLVVEVEVPGFKSGDVDVQIEEGVLVLRGERKQEKEEKTRQWHRSERYYGKFERRIALPEYADPQKVDATCKEGVLCVTLGKKPDVKPRAISVKVK
jgi:HSP20 family protein